MKPMQANPQTGADVMKKLLASGVSVREHKTNSELIIADLRNGAKHHELVTAVEKSGLGWCYGIPGGEVDTRFVHEQGKPPAPKETKGVLVTVNINPRTEELISAEFNRNRISGPHAEKIIDFLKILQAHK